MSIGLSDRIYASAKMRSRKMESVDAFTPKDERSFVPWHDNSFIVSSRKTYCWT